MAGDGTLSPPRDRGALPRALDFHVGDTSAAKQLPSANIDVGVVAGEVVPHVADVAPVGLVSIPAAMTTSVDAQRGRDAQDH